MDTNALQVINLSTYNLTPQEKSILEKGLSFSPMRILDKFEFVKDTYLFCRQLCFKLLYNQPSILQTLAEDERGVFMDLMDLLRENESETGRRCFTLNKPSLLTPSFNLFPNIQLFFQAIVHEIQKLKPDCLQGRNLNSLESDTIRKLQVNSTFVIKEADKGGNVVLWDMDLYIQEATRQLKNGAFYVPLPSDPTVVFKKKLDQLLKSARDMFIITKKEHQFLEVSEPIIPTFYMLPKVHKDLHNPPGRPIVAGIGGLCEQACTYLDFFLQPMVLGLPSYVRDSLHLIEMLEQLSITSNVLLVTCDVESLYTNIAHKDGISATTYFLEKSTSGEPAHRAFLGSKETCIQFIETLNQNDLNIHLTYNISDDTVEFLDLRLRKENERIATSLFRKMVSVIQNLGEPLVPAHFRSQIDAPFG
ncbi:uncharacterized protein LOC122927779 [Bufo gargarizans]|uniref:uncharacterized protein LOC122927779 n=1 Tax=Bufo gargarizans TaxID=30331 RepID=UPI001CF5B44B|nr:uncharacterized protein LOC122927779 [Bufo gargarizans]